MRIWPSKRRWKQLAIGLLSVIALLVAADGFMVWRTDARLAVEIAEIRAAGDPASIANLAPTPIPEDKNAAAQFQKLSLRLDEFASEYGRFYNSVAGQSYEAAVARGQLPGNEQLTTIRSILNKYDDVSAGLATVAACERSASVADFSLPPDEFIESILNGQISRSRTAARFDDWRVKLLLSEGKAQEAAQISLESLIRIRQLDSEPLAVNYLAQLAIRDTTIQFLVDAISSRKISSNLHSEIDAELARHDNPDRLVAVLKSDRAYSASVVHFLGDNTIDWSEWIYRKFVGWTVKKQLIALVDQSSQIISFARVPWPEIQRQLGPSFVDYSAIGRNDVGDLQFQAMRGMFDAHARDLAMVRCLRILNALAQYRKIHGREASGHADLMLPKAATVDPFSGQPLKLKHTLDGWIIYSVGTNGVDDGGDFKDQKDVGLGPGKRAAQ